MQRKKTTGKRITTDQNLRQFAGYNMKRAFMIVKDDMGRAIEPYGLRMMTFSALAVIVENPNITQTMVAKALHIERSGVVQLVDELEAGGLISRNRVEGDRRSYALRVTEKGAQVWIDAERTVHEHEAAVFGDLSSEEIEIMRGLLGRVTPRKK